MQSLLEHYRYRTWQQTALLIAPALSNSFLSVATKASRSCCNLPLQTTEEDKEKPEEVTVNLIGAKAFSVDAAVVAVLSQLNGIFTNNNKKKKKSLLYS